MGDSIDILLKRDDYNAIRKRIIDNKSKDISLIIYKAINYKSYESLSIILELKPEFQNGFVEIENSSISFMHLSIDLNDLYATQLLFAFGYTPLICQKLCKSNECPSLLEYAFRKSSVHPNQDNISKVIWATTFNLFSGLLTAVKQNDLVSLKRILNKKIIEFCALKRYIDHNPTCVNSTSIRDQIYPPLTGGTGASDEGDSWGNISKLFSYAGFRATKALSDWITPAWSSSDEKELDSHPLSKASKGNLPSDINIAMDWIHYKAVEIFYVASTMGHLEIVEYLLDYFFKSARISTQRVANDSLGFVNFQLIKSDFNSFLTETEYFYSERKCFKNNLIIEHNFNDYFITQCKQYENSISDRIFTRVGSFLTQKLSITGTNLVGSESDTALHSAIRNNHLKVVEFLIEHQPESCRTSSDNNSASLVLPIHTACSQGSVEALELLLNSRDLFIRDNPSQLQVYTCYLPDGTKSLYQHLFNIDQSQEHGLTPLMLAILNDNTECVKTLLNYSVPAHSLADDEDQSLMEDIDLSPLDPFPEEDFTNSTPDALASSEATVEVAEEAGFYNDNETVSSFNDTSHFYFNPIDLNSRIYAKSLTSSFNVKNRNCQLVIRPYFHCEDSEGDMCGSFTLLHLAIMQCNPVMIKEILKKANADLINQPAGQCLHVNEETSSKENILNSKFLSITEDDVGYVRQEQINAIKRTPLGMAIRLRKIETQLHDDNNQYSLEIIRLLLAYGAKDHQDILLLSAIEENDFTLASCLLANGCKPQKDEKNGLSIDWTKCHIQKLLMQMDAWQKYHDVTLNSCIDEACWFGKVREMIRQCESIQDDMLMRPVEVGLCLENLSELYLRRCGLKLCPQSFFTFLPNIKVLDLSHNKISFLPENLPIDSITSLSSNPTTVWCAQLNVLNLSHNLLRKLPVWLFDNSLANLDSKSSSFMNRAPSAARQNLSSRAFRFAPKLDNLNLSFNKIDVLPQQMWFNRSISSLDLGHNCLTSLPKVTMSQLISNNSFRRRRSRSTSENMIVTINNLINCDEMLDDAKKKTELLPCDKNSLVEILGPDNFCNYEENKEVLQIYSKNPFSGLIHLFLNNNKLDSIPLESQMNPSSIKRHIQNPLNRNAPQLPTNELDQMVPGLRTLSPNLITLTASHNKIENFGYPSDYPSKLTIFDLANNFIQRISLNNTAMNNYETGGSLPNLHTLSLSNNQVEIFEAINPVRGNDPTKPPVGNSSSKETKRLHESSINSRLWFPNLTMLELSGNTRLTRISSSIVFCRNINFIDLNGCQMLEELPSDLWRLENLKVLNINKTALWRQMQMVTDIPLDKTSSNANISTKAVIAYLRSKSSQAKPWSQLRINVLGPPKCGKTVLIQGLLNQNAYKKRTKKVQEDDNLLNVHSLTLLRPAPINIQPNPRMNNSNMNTLRISEVSSWSESVDFTVWDFATPFTDPVVSSVSMALQRYTFTKASINLLLWNISEGIEALERLHVSMVDLYCRQPNSLIIIIGTHGDTLNSWSSLEEAQNAVLRRFIAIGPDSSSFGIQPVFCQYILQASHSNGSASSTQYKDLATIIHKAANSLKLTGRSTAMLLGHCGIPSTPKRLIALPIPDSYHILEKVIRRFQETLKNDNRFPIITANYIIESTIEEINSQVESIGSKYQLFDELKFGLRFFHEIGLILYFPDPNMNKFLILDPVYVLNYLAKFILSYTEKDVLTDPNMERLQNKAGVVLLRNLDDMLATASFYEDVPHSNVLNYMQAVLARFEVAVPLDREHLIIPSLLPDLNYFYSSKSDRSLDPPTTPRQIRVTSVHNADDSSDDGDSTVSCNVYTLRRNSSHLSTSGISSMRIPQDSENPFNRFHPARQAVKKNVYKWTSISNPEEQICRIYSMSYIPSGFWTRLITRILTDTNLDLLCSKLYNVKNLPDVLKDSLIPNYAKSTAASANTPEYSYSGKRIRRKPTNLNYYDLSNNVKSQEDHLIPGWSVSKTSLRLTLGSGSIRVLSFEQVTEACSASVMLARKMEQDSTRKEPMADSSPNARFDYRSRKGCMLRYDQKADDFSVDTYNGFQTLCLIEFLMFNETIFWPDYRQETQNRIAEEANEEEVSVKTFSLRPNPQILAQIFTKILQHVDNLLEDWYPDLGSQFQQTTEGHYLINRIIPCAMCMSLVPSDDSPAQSLEETVGGEEVSSDQTFKLENAVEEMMNFYDLNDDSLRKNSKNSDEAVKNSFDDSDLFFITVEEYFYANFVKSSNDSNGSVNISCLKHPSTYLRAPDLLFEDLGDALCVQNENIKLESFLGRGSFGTVFKGTLINNQEMVSDLSISRSESESQIPVAIKVSTPIDPNIISQHPFLNDKTLQKDIDYLVANLSDTLCIRPKKIFTKCPPTRNSRESQSSDNHSSETTNFTAENFKEAIMFYEQQLKRWHLSSVESCYQAYQELRLELNVFYRITHWNLPEMISLTKDSSQFMTELLRLHPKNLLIFLGVVKPKPLGIVIPLAPKGSLSTWLETVRHEVFPNGKELTNLRGHPLHPLTICFFLYQILDALAFLHSLRIVHRDIKSDNILIWKMPDLKLSTDNQAANDPRNVQIMLADFGISRPRASLDGCRGYVGTPGYMAPEILEYLGEETYNEKVDIYSLGILICELLSLKNPYELGGENNPSLKFNFSQNVISGGRPKVHSHQIATTPSPVVRLMEMCWSQQPGERPTASKMLALLKRSSWLQSALALRHSPTTKTQKTSSLMRSSLSQSVSLKRNQSIRASFRKSRDVSTLISSHNNKINSLEDSKYSTTLNTIDYAVTRVKKIDQIRVLDYITCAVIDDKNRIWLGGYQVISGDKEHSGDHCPCSLANPEKKLTPEDISFPGINMKPGCYGRHGLLFVIFTSQQNTNHPNAHGMAGSKKFSSNKVKAEQCENCFLMTSWYNPIGIELSPFPTTNSSLRPNLESFEEDQPFDKEGWPIILQTSDGDDSNIVWCCDSNNWIHAYNLQTMCKVSSIKYNAEDPSSGICLFTVLQSDQSLHVCLISGTCQEYSLLRLTKNGENEENFDLKIYPTDIKANNIDQCCMPLNNKNFPRHVWVGQGQSTIQILRWSGFISNSNGSAIGNSVKPNVFLVGKRTLRSNNPEVSYITQLCTDNERIWSYQFPESNIYCWLTNSNQPIKCFNLNSLITQIPLADRGLYKSVGRVDNLILASNTTSFDLYATTSNGLLLSLRWPGTYLTAGPSAVVGDSSQISCQISAIHKASNQLRNFLLLKPLKIAEADKNYFWPNLTQIISVGIGQNQSLADLCNFDRSNPESLDDNRYSIIQMFNDEYFNDFS